ncbi:hypothetical protein VTL71DRAFT_5604 [Oculimacula yallundae]|uniref:Uncharacterized protein n=1 Tax=Oculimacula yallundae TaxID=86028 RepID=A0ABR4C384_9HELO
MSHSDYSVTASSLAAVALAKADDTTATINERLFMNAIQSIRDRVILGRKKALDSLYAKTDKYGNKEFKIHDKGVEHLPLKAMIRAREILSSGQSHYQFKTAIQFASALKAIRDVKGTWVQYDNQKNEFCFCLHFGENQVGWLQLDLDIPLMGCKQEIQARVAEIQAQKAEIEAKEAAAAREATAREAEIKANEAAAAIEDAAREAAARDAADEINAAKEAQYILEHFYHDQEKHDAVLRWCNEVEENHDNSDFMWQDIYLYAFYRAYPEVPLCAATTLDITREDISERYYT